MAGLDERWRAGLTALVAVAIPMAAGIAAGVNGNGDGPLLQGGVVVGACAATLLATRRGLWWLVPAQPMIVVPSTVGGVLLAEPRGTNHTKLGTDSVTALHHAFIITLVALGAVLVVALAKAVFGRGGDRQPGLAGSEPAPDGARPVGAHRG
ncbi:hypothetical protein KGQ20_21535 [Catenulispora sp. NF23]|uniref:DUF6542 domain-containing protein n=1 Tax=Catenulispora pinistramenti TaxID=2705254 RepID=A0ABS5KLY0_9ACTN|nr:DUF6542 domain-containing protein [Catenulispora pinistramenti]MBS2535351.1 hypothetical protein [Catenulispora pinistramenti]MBS2547054.1 hypothetical protein [Catenulispora pinistramenti]